MYLYICECISGSYKCYDEASISSSLRDGYKKTQFTYSETANLLSPVIRSLFYDLTAQRV